MFPNCTDSRNSAPFNNTRNQEDGYANANRHSSRDPSRGFGTPIIPLNLMNPSLEDFYSSTSVNPLPYQMHLERKQNYYDQQMSTPTPVSSIDDFLPDRIYGDYLPTGMPLIGSQASFYSKDHVHSTIAPDISRSSTGSYADSLDPINIFGPIPAMAPTQRFPTIPSNHRTVYQNPIHQTVIGISMLPFDFRIDPNRPMFPIPNYNAFEKPTNSSDPISRLNANWLSITTGAGNKVRSEFMADIDCVLNLGLSAVRNLAIQPPFSVITSNSKHIDSAFSYMTSEQRERMAQIVLHDLRHYLCDKKSSRFIISFVKEDEPFRLAVIEKLSNDSIPILTDKTGSLCIQKIVGLLSPECLAMFSNGLLKETEILVNHQYGNYAITKVIELESDQYKRNAEIEMTPQHSKVVKSFITQLIDKLLPKFDEYIDSKYSSPVLEGCIKHGDSLVRKRIEHFLLIDGTQSSRIRQYMGKEFANYVVQTSIDCSSDEEAKALFREGIKAALTNQEINTTSLPSRSSNKEAYVAKMLRKYSIVLD